MIDRRTLNDDRRGMGEGVQDSRRTKHKFWVLIENFNDSEPNESNEYQVPSLFSNHLSNSHIYPANIYFIDNQDSTQLDLKSQVSLFHHKFPCDLHMLNLRTLTEGLDLPSRSALMILHRQAFSCKFLDYGHSNQCTDGAFIANIFNNLLIERIISTSLTGLKTNDIIQNFSDIYVEPMGIRTFNLTFVN